jgi:hypothetical protein
LIRLPRPALTLFAGLVVVVASACGSSAATTGANGTGAPAGGANAPGSSVAAPVNPNDPNSIITQALSSGTEVKSFHIKIDIAGTIKASALQSAAGSDASGLGAALTSDIKLDGTSIEGDVDVANEAAHLAVSVPALAVLGNIPLTGDLIIKNNILYYQVSLLGAQYTEMDLGSLGSSLGALSSALPLASTLPTAASLTDEVAQVRQELQAAGVTTKLVGVEQIGGKNADHISVTIPLNQINAEIAAEASAVPGMKIDSATLDFWTYTDNYQLAKVQFTAASSTLGNISFAVTVTNYDAPVTITAPAASAIQSTTP